MKALLFLISCLLVPAVLTFLHQVWLVRCELHDQAQAIGTTVACRYSAVYGFFGGASSMFYGGILWTFYGSGRATFDGVGVLLGALLALGVLLIWLYLVTKITADELGVQSRGILGLTRSAAWTQIVKVDHTSQPRGWFRLHRADGRVIRVYPGMVSVPQLSAMILSRTLRDVIAPDTLDLLRRSAQGERIDNEQLNERLYVRSGPMLRLAGGLALVGLALGSVAWCGYAREAQMLRWASLELVQGLRQFAMPLALMFILWSLAFAAAAAVMAIKRALQRRRGNTVGLDAAH